MQLKQRMDIVSPGLQFDQVGPENTWKNRPKKRTFSSESKYWQFYVNSAFLNRQLLIKQINNDRFNIQISITTYNWIAKGKFDKIHPTALSV